MFDDADGPTDDDGTTHEAATHEAGQRRGVASRAAVAAVAVRCGGFADATLMAAGASRLVDDPRELIGTLG